MQKWTISQEVPYEIVEVLVPQLTIYVALTVALWYDCRPVAYIE